MANLNRNNLFAALGLAFLGFLCAVPLDWFTIRSSAFLGGSYTFNGIHGSISLSIHDSEAANGLEPGLSGTLLSQYLPIWFLLVISLAVTSVTISNVARLTSFSKFALLLFLLVPLTYYLMPLWYALRDGSGKGGQDITLCIGPFVAVLASLVVAAILLFTTEAGREDECIARRLAKRAFE